MGTFKWPVRISSMDGQQVQDIEATVDTGAAYTTLPAGLLRDLGVEPMGKRRFLLADGRRVDMRSDDRGLRRGRSASPARGLHPRGPSLGGRPNLSAPSSHPHDPVLGRHDPHWLRSRDAGYYAQAAFSASSSCHASISARLQAIALGVMRSGGGNAPALTSRHIVVRLIPNSRSTSFTLSNCIARTSSVDSPEGQSGPNPTIVQRAPALV